MTILRSRLSDVLSEGPESFKEDGVGRLATEDIAMKFEGLLCGMSQDAAAMIMEDVGSYVWEEVSWYAMMAGMSMAPILRSCMRLGADPASIFTPEAIAMWAVARDTAALTLLRDSRHFKPVKSAHMKVAVLMSTFQYIPDEKGRHRDEIATFRLAYAQLLTMKVVRPPASPVVEGKALMEALNRCGKERVAVWYTRMSKGGGWYTYDAEQHVGKDVKIGLERCMMIVALSLVKPTVKRTM